MIQEYIWEVKVKNAPLLNKKCNRCNSPRFYCSEKFRMNAQKKTIDIWLIYRCTQCDSTYNATIMSRTKPEVVSKELFKKFSDNDTETALKYGFSAETARVNNLELDYTSVEYNIENYGMSLKDIVKCTSEMIMVTIRYPLNFNLKTAIIIKECLCISNNQLNQLIEGKVFSIHSKHLQKRDKTKNDQIIQIDVEKLKAIVNLWMNSHQKP